MKSEDLKKLISQIKRYGLTEVFNNSKEFDRWLSKLNKKQLQNFNSLNIDPNQIQFPKNLLVNINLLNCSDYDKRIEAMLKLKNGDGCWHLFDRLCSLNFLNSKSYYEDIEMISKADTARYALWVINEDAFIQSKYHKEDLKLIVEAKDIKKDDKNELDYLVAEALATVAGNVDSINSPYHQKDMNLIANSGSECLQMSHSYPERSLNNLAINKVSLNDKYHLENMQILAKNSIIGEYLYNIMTNSDIVKGKNYRTEVESLINAKSKITARAIYYYITNPDKIYNVNFYDELYNCGLDWSEINLLNRDRSVKGNLNPYYVEYLKLLNEIDDKFVMYFESLLSNKDLINSQNQDYDLALLLKVTNKDVFIDLYKLMSDKTSLSGPYHKHDVNLISQIFNKKTRELLLKKATDEDSINSNNHKYDMNYIARLDLDNIEKERYNAMYYYLFNHAGINDEEHINMLEKLYSGEIIERHNVVLDYLDNLEKKLDNNEYNEDIKVKKISIFKKIFGKNN